MSKTSTKWTPVQSGHFAWLRTLRFAQVSLYLHFLKLPIAVSMTHLFKVVVSTARDILANFATILAKNQQNKFSKIGPRYF